MSQSSATNSPQSSDQSPRTQPTPSDSEQGPAKKRRTPGSCDHCRKRKAKCDSAHQPGNRCTRCTQIGLDCTHNGIIQNLGSARTYVTGMETRLEKCERLLAKVLPDVNLESDFDDVYKRLVLDPASSGKLPRNDDDSEEARLAGRMNYMQLSPSLNRFWGRSSNFMILETALKAKQDENVISQRSILNTHKRPEYWQQRPWQIPPPPASQPCPYIFPEIQLIFELVDLYFLRWNTFIPMLHRPTFEAGLAENLHHRDRGFGGTVLLVIAVGARFSSDPRVFLRDEGVDDEHSAGYRYIRQVELATNFKQQISLYELQQYILYSFFGEGFMWAEGWINIGVAIRRCMEVGAHRRRSAPPTPETELWKRAFWVLVWQERSLSTFFGRPVCLVEEDFDLDPPIACDDEFWEADFRQPESKPSTVSMFNCLLQLSEIQAHVLRTVYKTKKHRFSPVIASQQQFISSLDSAMNKWVENDIPSHLVLHPSNNNVYDPLFRQQTAYLYVSYYALQLYIHKPFIPLSDSPAVYPSLAISTNAARALLHVLSSADGLEINILPSIQAKAWIAGTILLIHIWSGIRSGLAPNPAKDMEDVTKSMMLLKKAEPRYQMSGKLGDILSGLAAAGEVGFPTPGVTSGVKRRREDDTDPVVSPPSASSSSTLPQESSPTFDFLFGSGSTSDFQFPTQSSALSQLPVFDLDSQLMAQTFDPFAQPTSAAPAPVFGSDASFSFTTLGNEPNLSNHLSWTADTLEMATGSGTQFQPLNQETLGLWSNTPASFNVDDWSNFVDGNASKLPTPTRVEGS